MGKDYFDGVEKLEGVTNEKVRSIIRSRSLVIDPWQPIETAPKDGTWILMCGGETHEDFYSIKGRCDHGKRMVVAMWDAENIDYEDNWVICHWDGSWRTGYQNPTHWMPLPQPPAI